MSSDPRQHVWTIGDYATVGDWFTSASLKCLDGHDLAGMNVLDVACGTGAVAIEAARRGANVHGVDLTPRMLEIARERAKSANVEVSWHQGAFEDLSTFQDFDLVTSAFGVMFASAQHDVAAQLLGAVRPGGTVSLTAWGPGGIFGDMSAEFEQIAGDLRATHKPEHWIIEEHLLGILDGLPARDVCITPHAIEMPFESVPRALEVMKEVSGPWIVAFEELGRRGLTDQATLLILDRFERHATPVSQGVTLRAEYAVTSFVRAS